NDLFGRIEYTRDVGRTNEYNRACIREDIVAGRNGDHADRNWFVRCDLDQTSTRCRACVIASVYGKVMLPALVNISRRPIADYTCNTAYFCAEREVTSPRCRINASPLLHDDDISGIGHFDGGSAEMFGGSGSAIISPELHGYHMAGDSALRRILV